MQFFLIRKSENESNIEMVNNKEKKLKCPPPFSPSATPHASPAPATPPGCPPPFAAQYFLKI